MLNRKISQEIEAHLASKNDKILILEGARQVGKSFIVRHIGKQMFPNFIELNFAEDNEGRQEFKDIHTTEEFYLQLSATAGTRLGTSADTLIFLDEIQQYPQYFTLLKFLRQEARYTYIASGSLLGIALRTTTSIPVGSIIRKQMYPLDFEEFLWAVGVGTDAIATAKDMLHHATTLPIALHNLLLSHFQRYLLVGGMPDAVNEYVASHNIVNVREIQHSIRNLYEIDAAKYEADFGRKLLIRRIYQIIPSQMENKKKRIVAQSIRDRKGDRFEQYQQEFEYLVSSGIALDVRAVSNPRYPLVESVQKNLLKLYLNDVGILTALLYGNNIRSILDDTTSVNLGAVYESATAQELRAHGHDLFYYDNKQRGEVDFLVNDTTQQSLLPIEVKSGKDYRIHSALTNMLATSDYGINRAIVLSNSREITCHGGVTYYPIYALLIFQHDNVSGETIF